MMKIFTDNILSDTCSTVVVAALPFITLGLMGNKPVLYVSISLGTLAMIGLIGSIVFKKLFLNERLLKAVRILNGDYLLPYVIALSAMILQCNGVDAVFGLWIALGMFILMVSGTVFVNVAQKKKMNQSRGDDSLSQEFH